MSKGDPKKTPADEEVLRASRRHTRRSFAVGAIAAAAGYGIYRWIDGSPHVGYQPLPLRRGLNFDAALSRALFNERGFAPTYRVDQSRDLRLNGVVGLDQQLVMDSWRLQMVGVAGAEKLPQYVKDVTTWQYRYVGDHPLPAIPDTKSPSGVGGPQQPSITERFEQMNRALQHRRVRGDDDAGPSDSALYDGTPGLLLAMGDLARFPKTELVTQFKCIEGWSEIVHWRGIRLRDLLMAYPPAKKADGTLPRYVYMETPDGYYYTGYNLSACLHPQSLLTMEMGGKPLTQEHGAPLRLHMPIKYGYKQIKRIGLIAYTDEMPDDYWGKLGYDWYGGL